MRRRRNADAPIEEANRSTNTPDEMIRETEAELMPSSAEPTEPNSTAPDTPPAKGRRRSGGRSGRTNAEAAESLTPSVEAVSESANEPIPPTGEPEAPLPAESTRRSRTSTRRKSAETPVDVEVAHLINEVAPEPEPGPVAESPVVAKPTRTHRSTRRAVTAPQATVEVVAEVSAPPETVPTPEPVASDRTKRSRTRTPKAEAAQQLTILSEGETKETSVAPPEPEAPAVAVPILETTVVNEVPPATTSSRRRGRGKGKSDNGAATRDAESQAKPTPPVIEEKSRTAPAGPTSKETPGPASQRVRGIRQRLPARPTTLITTSSPIVPPPVPPTESADKTDATPSSRRVRGLRRTVTRPVVVAPVVPPTVTPVEVVPPGYQPLPIDTLARLVEGKVVLQKGAPQLMIGGESRVPMWFFVNTEDTDSTDTAVRQIRMAYEAGVRIFTALAHLPWKGRSGERRYEPLDSALQLIADNAPDAFILPRFIFSPPPAWVKQHDSEMTRYADGEQGDVSLASESFWNEEAQDAVRAAVERIAQGPHAGRVFGFYLEHGEWFYEKGRGYDVSEANQKGFRSWLRRRYRNNQVALRAAWFDATVSFDRAQIPPYPAPPSNTLFYSRREQRYRDYHEYASDIVADVILNLGKAVKEASGGRTAVAVSYGYTLELPRAASGHSSLGALLASPYVDILTGPLSYTARTPGGAAPVPAPLDSIHLAGKLWVSEDDTKTYLSADDTPDSYNPRVESAESTWAVHSRNFGAAVARGAGISYMDLWGQGWLEDRDLWRGLGRLRGLAETLTRVRNESVSAPDVAVIVDERVFFDVRADESLLGSLITQQRDALLRSGARIGFYLLSDLTKPEFPDSVKLLLFLNAFRLPDTVRTAIRERYQNSGRTIAWVYGPGAIEDNQAELTEVLGLSVRLQPWGSKTGTQLLSNVRSPLTDALRGQRLGSEARCNPSFYVTDPKAQVLGEYVGSGNPSVVVRKHARWQSVFIGETDLPLPLLRGLYRLAGVPTFTADDDVAWVGDNIICLHSAPGGGTNVYLPEEAVIADLLTGEVVATDGYGARLSMPPQGTRLLFFGTPEQVSRFGIDPKAGPQGLTRSELPAVQPIGFENEPAMPPVLNDDALLFAAALEETPEVLDKDEIEETVEPEEGLPLTAEAVDAETARKRRRRRRRRGKGGRDADLLEGVGEEAGEEAAGAEEDESDESVSDGQQVRLRPSLEELLPQSDIPVGSEDLPPIPDEFLPLSDTALTLEAEVTEETPRSRSRSRRGSGGRRNRRFGPTEEEQSAIPMTEESAEVEGAGEAPDSPREPIAPEAMTVAEESPVVETADDPESALEESPATEPEAIAEEPAPGVSPTAVDNSLFGETA